MNKLVPGTIAAQRYRVVTAPASALSTRELLGLDERLGRRVTLILGPAPSWTEQGRRFVARAEAAALVRHAAFPMTYDITSHEEYPLLVQERVDAPILARAVMGSPPWPARRAIYLIARLCEAMGEAHAAGLTHGALHATSLLLDGDDIVVPDLAWPHPHSARDAVYAAPEIHVGAAAAPAADVFALCMLLRRLLDRADAPLPALEDTLRCGTARDPSVRPADGARLRQEIEAALIAPSRRVAPTPAPLPAVAPVQVRRVTPPPPRHRARPVRSALRLLPALALCAAVVSPTARSWISLHPIENSLSQAMTALSSFAAGATLPGDAPPSGWDGASGGPGVPAPSPFGPGGDPPPRGHRGHRASPPFSFAPDATQH